MPGASEKSGEVLLELENEGLGNWRRVRTSRRERLIMPTEDFRNAGPVARDRRDKKPVSEGSPSHGKPRGLSDGVHRSSV